MYFYFYTYFSFFFISISSLWLPWRAFFQKFFWLNYDYNKNSKSIHKNYTTSYIWPSWLGIRFRFITIPRNLSLPFFVPLYLNISCALLSAAPNCIIFFLSCIIKICSLHFILFPVLVKLQQKIIFFWVFYTFVFF